MRIFYFIYKDNSGDNTIEKYRDYFKNVDIDDIELITYDGIQKFLSDDIKSIDGDSLFLIPAVLDSFNAYSYDGVELALRIYFYHVINRRNKFRIAILGTEDKAAFWEHCRYSNILKCPHVDFTNNNLFAIKEYLSNLKPINSIIDWDTCIENLKRLNIQPPASYKSHHSITNEWCIYRWSKYLGIENVAIQKEIEDHIYFDYLKTIYHIDPINKSTSFFLNNHKGKVLLIDDEVLKGWDSFFKSLFNYSPNIKYDSMGDDFKSLSQDKIVENVRKKIKCYNPDVVILDLRLHDKDYDAEKTTDLTGIKIFKSIKEINKGIQIIVFSASNKVWNYLPFASNGVIIKESPEMSVRKNYTNESISNLEKTINKCLDKKYLKDIYVKVDQIKKLLLNSNYFGEKTEETLGNLDVAFDLLTNGLDNVEYFAYAYLQLFIVIESYLNLDTVFKDTFDGFCLLNGMDSYKLLKDKKGSEYQSIITYDDRNKTYTLNQGVFKRDFIDTNFRGSAILIFKFGEKTSNVYNWKDIIYVRNNKAAHPQKAEVTLYDINKIIDFMLFFFDDNNAKWRPLTDAFSGITIEEGVSLLQEKFCNSTTNI